MGGVAKPLLDVCGKPMILRIIDAVRGLCRRTVVIYSDHTAGILELCRGPMGPVECVKGGGGYVEDLKLALNLVSLPALVIPADTPFLDQEILGNFVLKALLTAEPIVNLVDMDRGLVGITLFKDRMGAWIDVTVRGGHRLIDVDTWDDYREAVSLCKDTMAVR